MPSRTNELLSEIPKFGLGSDEVLAQMDALSEADADWRSGRTWCLVYHAGDDHSHFLKHAHNKFFSENALNPIAFSSLKKMEASAVAMTASMMNANDKAVGSLTSGGTESLLLAVKTYRDRARRKKPWIFKPNMVVPRSIHAAFEKASHYFGVKMKIAKLNDDYRVSLRDVTKQIDRNTIAIAGSAPNYPQGVIDDIAGLGEIANKRRLPLHVDACVGGFILPWLEKIGEPIPPWDFRVDGVTSISADLHKYGYTAKGASALIFKDMSYMRHQFFVSTDWPGGVYASASIPGTKPGGPIAAAWATLAAIGADGYEGLARRVLAVKAELIARLDSLPEVELVGKPDATLVSFRCTPASGINTLAVADRLQARNWHFDRHQFPSAIHCTCGVANEGMVEEFVRDIEASIEEVRANPEVAQQGDAALYGMMANIPARGVVKYSVQKIMEKMYSPGTGDVDLSELGKSGDDPILFRMIEKYGDELMLVTEKVNKLTHKLFKRS